MDNVDRIFEDAKDAAVFADGYLEYLGRVLDSLDRDAIATLIGELEAARSRDATIFIAGNGGSAATASHMANDLGLDVYKKSGTDTPFRALALTDAVPSMTAIANDDSYDSVFVTQLHIHYREGDLLIAISASGDSPNVVRAAEWVRENKGRVAAFTGFGGGRLREIADVVVHVETERGEYGPVEDAHMVLDHLIGSWLQRASAEGPA